MGAELTGRTRVEFTKRQISDVVIEADTCRKYVVPKLQAAGWEDGPRSPERVEQEGAEEAEIFSCSRRERGDRLKRERRDFFGKFDPEARAVLSDLLDKYTEHGATQFRFPELCGVIADAPEPVADADVDHVPEFPEDLEAKKKGIMKSLLIFCAILLIHFSHLSATAATNCISPPSGLVGWWSGDGHAKDYAGSHGGQLISGTRFAAGKVASCFRFDGTDDRVLVNDSPDLQFTNSFTIEAWIFVSGLPTFAPHAMICFRGDDRSGLDPYYLSIQPSGMLAFHIESSFASEHMEVTVPNGTWVYIAATLEHETGSMRLYVNAEVVAETTTSVRPLAELDSAFAGGLGIGNHSGIPNVSGNMPFNGLIDELRLYSRALTSSEIRAIFDAGSIGLCKAVMDIRLYPGVTLDAPVGTDARVEYLDALGISNDWIVLTNITLPSTPYLFIDTQAATLNQRIYRAVLLQ